MTKKLGKEFEQAVAKVQSLIDINAKIKTNEIIEDRLGQKREFDVTIRSISSGFDVLGVIECKDLNRPVGLEIIDSFNTKATDVNANIKVIVSKKGFTKTAIDKARFYSISTLSLLPADDSNFDVGLHITANIYWIDGITISLIQDFPFSSQELKVDDLRLNEKKIVNWYKNYLIENYKSKAETGNIMEVEVEFSKTQLLEMNGHEIGCKGIRFCAHRNIEVKSKNIPISGDGYFDWGNKRFIPQPDGTLRIKLNSDDFDFHLWPKKSIKDDLKQSGFIINAMNNSVEYEPDAIQLEKLGFIT